ncbi:hypothetical protein [Tengunoibacter tsumagoiensis]|uniref:Glycosyltransferase RgtA/B/C/D-like domain-containing protein n=1 Tax=Tengunoibacter tsumagoiensis TaxID=2014871 RepID=A0A402A0X2_9CHLR|nr:hypothetical protein [Tengunoibacter tsumagoiensis]GCE12661.1 hypothetical protein KTT_25200 [Tengunoibacter tsumagoiensis]
MKDLNYQQQLSSVHLDREMSVHSASSVGLKGFKWPELISLVLPVVAFLLWSLSLQHEDVRKMNDLGMVSTFPPLIFVALAVLIFSFGFTLLRPRISERVLFFHLILLILMLFATQSIVEEAPRFAVVYRHAGYTDYIMRNGSVNPDLDAYFSWPGFFVFSAMLTQLAGYHDILGYAGWAPVVYNLIYMGPLYMILRTLSVDKRLIWLAMWLFFLTNWIGQDYFSPQGLNFFLYLVIMAIVLRWLQPPARLRPGFLAQKIYQSSAPVQKAYSWLTTPLIASGPVRPIQKGALVVILLLVFGFVVCSHPLTPFFVLTSMFILLLFNRCSPRWLPLIMAVMAGAWIFFMTKTFLSGHSSMVVGNVGQVSSAVSTNVTSHIQGNSEHMFVAMMRIVMTVVVWGLAFLGCIRRVRFGQVDIVAILLAIAPFPLIAAQQYGGEMFLRIYLFALPFMVFFAAAFFFPRLHPGSHPRLLAAALLILHFGLFFGFLFTRYGNERMDYVTYNELAGIRHLYQIAPERSFFLGAGDVTPWPFEGFEKYGYDSMDDDPALSGVVATRDVMRLELFLKAQHAPNSYVVFTRGQEAQLELFYGLPSDALNQFATALVHSGDFTLIYHNSDVRIYSFAAHTRPDSMQARSGKGETK